MTQNVLSAAIKACAKDGDVANGRRLFVEGRRAAGIATDNAADVAAAAVAAAAAAAESGTATPATPARVNPGVEAVYMSALTVSWLAAALFLLLLVKRAADAREESSRCPTQRLLACWCAKLKVDSAKHVLECVKPD